MTPIHPKDRPKVITLGVLTFVMLGFFLMSVLGAVSKKEGGGHLAIDHTPPQDPTAPAPTPTPPSGPAISATVTPAPKPPVGIPATASVAMETSAVNPFRHVLPDPVAIQQMIAAQNRPAAPKNIPPMHRMGGVLPGPGVAPMVTVASAPPVVPPAPMIRLDGVVTDRDRYAMVTFNDRTDMYHVGTRVAGMFTVLTVSDTGASFRGPKGVFKLEIGDERNAAAPVPKPAALPPHASTVVDTRLSTTVMGSKLAGAAKRSFSAPAAKPLRYSARPQDAGEYATLPLPSFEGPAAGRGH